MTVILNHWRGLLHHADVGRRALWKEVAKASRHMAWPEMLRRRSIYAGGVSSEWLRANAIESAKHFDDS